MAINPIGNQQPSYLDAHLEQLRQQCAQNQIAVQNNTVAPNMTAQTNPIQQNSVISQPVINQQTTVDTFNGKTAEQPKVTADGADDGHISAGSILKNFGKGLISPVTAMFTSVKGFAIGAGMIAGGALLTAATGGAILPLLVAGGVGFGAIQLGSGAYKAANAKTDAEAEEAWQGIGAGTSTIALSVVGSKSALKHSGVDTADMGYLKATAKCFEKTPSSISDSVKAFTSGDFVSNLGLKGSSKTNTKADTKTKTENKQKETPAQDNQPAETNNTPKAAETETPKQPTEQKVTTNETKPAAAEEQPQAVKEDAPAAQRKKVPVNEEITPDEEILKTFGEKEFKEFKANFDKLSQEEKNEVAKSLGDTMNRLMLKKMRGEKFTAQDLAEWQIYHEKMFALTKQVLYKKYVRKEFLEILTAQSEKPTIKPVDTTPEQPKVVESQKTPEQPTVQQKENVAATEEQSKVVETPQNYEDMSFEELNKLHESIQKKYFSAAEGSKEKEEGLSNLIKIEAILEEKRLQALYDGAEVKPVNSEFKSEIFDGSYVKDHHCAVDVVKELRLGSKRVDNELVEALDNEFAQLPPTKKELTTFRAETNEENSAMGVARRHSKAMNEAQVGDIITDKGYMYTAFDKNVWGSCYAGKKKFLYEIRIPKGAKISRNTEHANNGGEALFPRNAQFKILNKNVSKDGQTYFVLEYILPNA